MSITCFVVSFSLKIQLANLLNWYYNLFFSYLVEYDKDTVGYVLTPRRDSNKTEIRTQILVTDQNILFPVKVAQVFASAKEKS